MSVPAVGAVGGVLRGGLVIFFSGLLGGGSRPQVQLLTAIFLRRDAIVETDAEF
jgi:hypothetical protein